MNLKPPRKIEIVEVPVVAVTIKGVRYICTCDYESPEPENNVKGGWYVDALVSPEYRGFYPADVEDAESDKLIEVWDHIDDVCVLCRISFDTVIEKRFGTYHDYKARLAKRGVEVLVHVVPRPALELEPELDKALVPV